MMNTQFIRNKVAQPLHWGWWHVDCFAAAADAEGKTIRDGLITFDEAHTFTDPSDGEVLNILPGDQFYTWR